MKSFAEHMTEDRRLAILRFLAAAPGYSGNEGLLRQALLTIGHNVARDVLRTDIAWLAEQGLATTEELGDVWVATITPRGEDAAAGRAQVPGVKRPGP